MMHDRVRRIHKRRVRDVHLPHAVTRDSPARRATPRETHRASDAPDTRISHVRPGEFSSTADAYNHSHSTAPNTKTNRKETNTRSHRRTFAHPAAADSLTQPAIPLRPQSQSIPRHDANRLRQYLPADASHAHFQIKVPCARTSDWSRGSAGPEPTCPPCLTWRGQLPTSTFLNLSRHIRVKLGAAVRASAPVCARYEPQPVRRHVASPVHENLCNCFRDAGAGGQCCSVAQSQAHHWRGPADADSGHRSLEIPGRDDPCLSVSSPWPRSHAAHHRPAPSASGPPKFSARRARALARAAPAATRPPPRTPRARACRVARRIHGRSRPCSGALSHGPSTCVGAPSVRMRAQWTPTKHDSRK